VRDAIGAAAARPLATDLEPRRGSFEAANTSLDVPGYYQTHELHVSRYYTDLSLKRFRHIPPGGNRFDLPLDLQAPCWQRHTTGSGDVMGRLHWDRPSVTIRTEFWKPEKGRYLHPTADRAITHMEAALLQGFPEDYRWCGTKVTIGRQIGNAVPVELGRAVARAVLAALESAGIEPR
jgi:DNA (cytosine-5)-methyltransferase 1